MAQPPSNLPSSPSRVSFNLAGDSESSGQKNMADSSGDSPGQSGAPPGKPRMMKKSSSMYLNVRLPHKPDRPDVNALMEANGGMDGEDAEYDPSNKVQTLINSVRDPKHKTHKIFCEMDVLKKRGEEYEWREAARWVKYEEVVEEGGKRWSKPHVASLSMHYLVLLRRALMDGAIFFDVECYSISQVIERFLDEWIKTGDLSPLMRQHVRMLALSNHRHRHERGRHDDKKKLKGVSTNPDLQRVASAHSFGSSHNLQSVSSAVSLSSTYGSEQSLESMESEVGHKKHNEKFLRKIPKGAEVANLMIAPMEDLDTMLCGFMRLNDARVLGSLTEVELPTRFMFFMFGPPNSVKECTEMGRCMATMLVDDVFREVVYKCRDVDDLIAGVDEFIEQVTVLPPGEWDPKIRIEPPDKVPSQEFRKTPSTANLMGQVEEEHSSHADPTLVMTGKPFLGLIRDIKSKVPFFWSDFKDALHVQCIASFIYIFLATLTPNVTFGGMLGKETDQYMGVMECIFSAAITGVFFALFSGQPMNILGSTGPMLVLEKIIYNFCKEYGWDYLPFRAWIGIWTAAFLFIMVMFDLSALVRYITRFTEESFATLIAAIFIYEAFAKLFEINHEEAPLLTHPTSNVRMPHCSCHFGTHNASNASSHGGGMAGEGHMPMTTAAAAAFGSTSNMSDMATNMTMAATTMASTAASSLSTTVGSTMSALAPNMSHENMTQSLCEMYHGEWTCDPPHYVPDAFLFSILLFLGTFGLAIFLKDFKNWVCFPSWVRQMLSDFSVLLSIIIFVLVDWALGLPTPKLTVPTEFKPTRPDRDGWFVNPMSDKNPWWLPIAGGLPAILATILIFLDQQITAVIVNRKENLLKKGKGYHLDLLCVCLLVAACSLLGLPWYVAATVSAIAHLQSLRKESETTAPGDKPTFLGIREQRVTALLVGILSGVAVLITNILKFIPMPVLYGVFLFMGFSALRGMQFIDRILLFLMPLKYQPDYPYLRHVPLWRVHLFTFIQIVCLVILWVVKSIKTISIAFPLLVLATGVVRKMMELSFTKNELKWLDDLLPPINCGCGCCGGKSGDDEELVKAIEAKPAIATVESSFKKNGAANGEKTNFYIAEEERSSKGKSGITNNAFDTKL